MKLGREFYIPKGSTKVSDKHSDAVAYIYTSREGHPCAALFLGKQAKPASTYRYRSEAARCASITKAFADYQAHKARVVERRQAPSATATRNAAIKALLETEYGRGKVSVTGARGTAYGWIDARITAPDPGEGRAAVIRRILAAGIALGHYDSGDYGSGYEIHVHFSG